MNYPPVVLLIDMNCFYAQVEILKSPWLKHKPVAVVQKHLIVTSNYIARARGVLKCTSLADAKNACPDIVLINGENLDDYRKASEAFFDLIHSTLDSRPHSNPQSLDTIQRVGLDELFVDISALVDQILIELRTLIASSDVYPPSIASASSSQFLECKIKASSSSKSPDVPRFRESSLITRYFDVSIIQRLLSEHKLRIAGFVLQCTKGDDRLSVVIHRPCDTLDHFVSLVGTDLDLTDWIDVIKKSSRRVLTGEEVLEEWRSVFPDDGSAYRGLSVQTPNDLERRPDNYLSRHFEEFWNSRLLELRLAIGSHVCQSLRSLVEKELGLTTSAGWAVLINVVAIPFVLGVAWSKVSSKLTASSRKPECQTVLLPEIANSFIQVGPIIFLLQTLFMFPNEPVTYSKKHPWHWRVCKRKTKKIGVCRALPI